MFSPLIVTNKHEIEDDSKTNVKNNQWTRLLLIKSHSHLNQ